MFEVSATWISADKTGTKAFCRDKWHVKMWLAIQQNGLRLLPVRAGVNYSGFNIGIYEAIVTPRLCYLINGTVWVFRNTASNKEKVICKNVALL